MQILEATRNGMLHLTRQELAQGIGQAEACRERGRVYCAECYPARPPNTCVCGLGRDAVVVFKGTIYRGSLSLVKVRYLT